MSLMAMNRFIKRYGVVFGIVIGLAMVISVAFTSLGSMMPGMRGGPGGGAGGVGGTSVGTSETPLATVGDEPVTGAMLDAQVDNAIQRQAQQMAMMGQPAPNPSAAEKAQLRYSALTAVQQQQALVAAAKKAGITVSDQDLEAERQKIWQLQRGGLAQSLGLPEKATDSEIEREMAKQQPGMTIQALLHQRLPDNALRLQVYHDKLVDNLKKENRVAEADVRRSYDDIAVRHILIKTGQGGLPDAQAKVKAEKILAQVQANPAQMGALADQYSEDPGNVDPKTKKKNGGLYPYAPGAQYVPEFTQGALAAGVGKVNPQPIKTQFGYHIIKLEGEKPGASFPKDFDKNKQQYLDEYADKQIQSKLQAAVDAEVPSVKIDVTDPMLKAFQALSEAKKATAKADQDAKYNQVLTELAKVKTADDVQGVIPQTQATIYTALGKTKEAISALEQSVKFGNTAETRIALAKAYLADKNTAEAQKQLDEAEKLAIPDIQLQFQLADLWRQTGNKERAAAAQKKSQEMLQRMMQMNRPAVAPPAPVAPAKAAPTSGTAPVGNGSPAEGTPAPAATPAPTPAAK